MPLAGQKTQTRDFGLHEFKVQAACRRVDGCGGIGQCMLVPVVTRALSETVAYFQVLRSYSHQVR